MINLAAEELIPLKTKFKLRNGKTATFVTKSGADIAKILIDGTIEWSVWMENGKSNRAASVTHEDDIVAIGKRWEPKPGDKVTVCGIAMREDGNDFMNFNCGHESDDTYRIVRVIESGEATHCVFAWNDGPREYQIHRDNIRRAK